MRDVTRWLAGERAGICLVVCGLAVVLIDAGCGNAGSSPVKQSPTSLSSTSAATGSTPTARVPPNSRAGGQLLQDLSWVSASEGWALAAQPCATGTCTLLAHTTDGGGVWQALPDPPAHLLPGLGFAYGASACSRLACVSELRFASPSVGYLYGPGLLMTTDGGQSWQAQHGLQVETLSVADGNAYRVAYGHVGCPGPCQPTLQESQVGSGTWRTLIGQLASPDRSGAAQIVASGSTLMLALYGSQAGPVSAQASVYRSTDAAASWRRQADPCSGRGPGGKGQEEDLIDLAAAPGGFFAGLCSPHTGNGTFLITSTDGGGSWQTAGALPAVQALSLLAAASPTTIAVSTPATSGGGAYTARLLVSTDGGRQWRTAATDRQQITRAGVPAWIGFQSSRVGSWIGDPHGVWSTLDGGSHWKRVAFP